MRRIQDFLSNCSARLSSCAVWIFIGLAGMLLAWPSINQTFELGMTIPPKVQKIAVPLSVAGIATTFVLAAACTLLSRIVFLVRLLWRSLSWMGRRLWSLKRSVLLSLLLALAALVTSLGLWLHFARLPAAAATATIPAPAADMAVSTTNGAETKVPAGTNTRSPQQFYAAMKRILPKLDSGGKGFITEESLEWSILRDHSIKGEEAAALYTLKSMFSDLAVKDADGQLRFGQARLAELQSKPSAVTEYLISEEMQSSYDFLRKVNRGLYPSGSNSHNLERSVAQVKRGNCYFQSGMSSLAAINPEQLKKLISDNGINANGVRTFTVHFPRAGESYQLEELTDAGLLVNDVAEDSGTWLTLLIRAYGMYNQCHPTVRLPQRWWFELDQKILPEDITDHGSMYHDGLSMATPSDTYIQDVIWFLDRSIVSDFISDNLISLKSKLADELASGQAKVKSAEDFLELRTRLTQLAAHFSSVEPGQTPVTDSSWLSGIMQDLAEGLRSVDDARIKTFAQSLSSDWLETVFEQAVYSPRDAAVVHQQLQRSICEQNLPATVLKQGGQHEAAIINYRAGTSSADGKHSSQYGFVTIRDQAGLDGEEQSKIAAGKWWREDGCDGFTVTMTVEDFTATYSGFASVLKR